MKLIDPKCKKNKKDEQPDITQDHLDQLKRFIKKAAQDAGEEGVDVIELMKNRRENKSGAKFWQCLTEQHWLDAGKEIEQEFAIESNNIVEEN